MPLWNVIYNCILKIFWFLVSPFNFCIKYVFIGEKTNKMFPIFIFEHMPKRACPGRERELKLLAAVKLQHVQKKYYLCSHSVCTQPTILVKCLQPLLPTKHLDIKIFSTYDMLNVKYTGWTKADFICNINIKYSNTEYPQTSTCNSNDIFQCLQPSNLLICMQSGNSENNDTLLLSACYRCQGFG